MPASIGRLALLETLNIQSCDALQGRQTSIEQCRASQGLSLHNLPKIAELPATIAALTNLQHLSICRCALAELPVSIDMLTALHIHSLPKVPALPASIGTLTQLTASTSQALSSRTYHHPLSLSRRCARFVFIFKNKRSQTTEASRCWYGMRDPSAAPAPEPRPVRVW